MDLRRIKNDTFIRKHKKRDNVFCIIYCRDAQPYLNYDVYRNSKDKLDRDKVHNKYPMILAQMRHDGKIGFPGGKVEKDNASLLDGLLRELDEEINFNNINIEKIEFLSTYSNHKAHTTTFVYEVSFEEMISIVNNSRYSKHSFIENMGSFILRLDQTTLKNIVKHNFSGTGAKDLNLLIKKKKLL